MQGIRHWTASACIACVLAVGMGACGGSSSEGDKDSSDSGSNDSGSNGTSGGSGGSGDNGSNNGTSAGNGNTSSGNGSGTTGLSMGVPVEVEEYFEQAAAIVCEWLTPCCGEIGLAVTESNCSSTIGAQFAADYASADPDNYTYDADLGGDCLATARQLYSELGCQLDTTAGEIDPATDALCEQVFQGKLEPGAPCSSDIECAKEPGDEVDCTTLDSDVNVCVIERRAAEGDSCYWTCTDEAAGGYFCSGTAAEEPALQGRCFTNDQLACEDGVCARQPGLGEACATNGTCSEGFCLSGICSPGGASGAACQVDSECAEGLYCESTACAPKKPDGDACELSAECESESCSDGVCGAASQGDFAIALLCAVASGQL